MVRWWSISDGSGARSAGRIAAPTPRGSASPAWACGTRTSSTSWRRRRSTRWPGDLRRPGLKYLEVEFLADFFAPRAAERAERPTSARRKLFETAAAFDAHHIKVGNIPGTPCELDRLTEEFAALCDDAADHTDAKVAYEFMPFDVNVSTLEPGCALVQRRAARPTAGWRSTPGTWASSDRPPRTASIPAEHLAWVELSDGQVQNMEDEIDEVINHRHLPGEGEFDIPGYVEALHARPATPEPWGVEVLSAQLRSLPIEQEFDRAYETTVAQFRAGVSERRPRMTTCRAGRRPPDLDLHARCCASGSSRSASSARSTSTPA